MLLFRTEVPSCIRHCKRPIAPAQEYVEIHLPRMCLQLFLWEREPISNNPSYTVTEASPQRGAFTTFMTFRTYWMYSEVELLGPPRNLSYGCLYMNFLISWHIHHILCETINIEAVLS
jgi:hypothetical protein